jgi:hypothetical protein
MNKYNLLQEKYKEQKFLFEVREGEIINLKDDKAAYLDSCNYFKRKSSALQDSLNFLKQKSY